MRTGGQVAARVVQSFRVDVDDVDARADRRFRHRRRYRRDSAERLDDHGVLDVTSAQYLRSDLREQQRALSRDEHPRPHVQVDRPEPDLPHHML